MARQLQPTHEPNARLLRADAERNRERILTAAREVFAERGLDAPFEAIAQRAGVGQATLYRRFPRRQDLIVACFAPKLAEYAAAVEEALAATDAWTGFCAFFEHVCTMQAADQGGLRADFVPEDVVLLLMANAGVVRAMRDAAPDAWRRFVGLMLDALRADRAHPLPPPPTPAQTYRAMLRASRTEDA